MGFLQTFWFTKRVLACNSATNAARLVHTGKNYRLPSEAEWEYACRAATTTPFYFGETITSELANYAGSKTFADETKGEYRGETTDVGIFPPNAFGLYDMHGLVLEWCVDDLHLNYQETPTDGKLWIKSKTDNDNQNFYRFLRGGSWSNTPVACRSASRPYGYVDNYVGFRVVVSRARTLFRPR